MKIYTYWNSTSDAPDDQAECVRLWERSWRQHGWEPRLLTLFNARKAKHYSEGVNLFKQMALALHSVGGGWMSLPTVINNGLQPYRPGRAASIHGTLRACSEEAFKGPCFTRGSDVYPYFLPFARGIFAPWEGDPHKAQCFVFSSAKEILDSGLCH